MNEATTPKMHRVKYELTYTKNLGNFENVKIGVGLEVDGSGNPDVTYAKVREWVEENLSTTATEVVDSLEGK